MVILDATTGTNLRQYREQLGFTQDALATYLGVSRPVISYYETGERAIPTAQLTRLADLLGVEEYDLMYATDDQHQANIALAFRADQLQPEDLDSIAAFRRVVKNYLKMKEVLAHGNQDV